MRESLTLGGNYYLPVMNPSSIQHWEEILYDEGGEALEHFAQGSRWCPVIESGQGQDGWSFVEGGLDDL